MLVRNIIFCVSYKYRILMFNKNGSQYTRIKSTRPHSLRRQAQHYHIRPPTTAPSHLDQHWRLAYDHKCRGHTQWSCDWEAPALTHRYIIDLLHLFVQISQRGREGGAVSDSGWGDRVSQHSPHNGCQFN